MAIADYYNTGDNTAAAVYGNYWYAQTFTAGSSYTITSAKIKLYKSGSPGTITLSVRATSGDLPTGADLCSGNYDGDTLGSSPGAFVEFDFGVGTSLTSGTKYALVLDGGPNVSNCPSWRLENPGGYSNGRACSSINAGSSWSGVAWDLMFETYSSVEDVDVSGTIAGVSSVTGSATVLTVQAVTGTIAGVSSVSGVVAVEANWQTDTFKNTKRLVIAGNDSIYYEDI